MKNTIRFLRGQVWFLREDENRVPIGSVIRKSRPWLIVSCDENNQNSPVLICVPITTRVDERYPSHVYFKSPERDQTILCEQVTTKSVQEFSDTHSSYMFTLSEEIMSRVSIALMGQLGLNTFIPGKGQVVQIFEDIVKEQAELSIKDRLRITEDAMIDLALKIKELVSPIELDVDSKETPKDQINEGTLDKKDQVKKTWTLDMKRDFLSDADKLSAYEMARKYDISRSLVYSYKHSFKKALSRI